MTLHWTLLATDHLRAAYEYVARDSIAAADRLLQRIVSATEILEKYPNIGRTGRADRTRELVIAGTPFIVVYRITEEIQVLAVFHASRRWPEGF